MPRQKNPNGMGSYDKLKDGRVRWRQMVDGQTRTITAKTMPELQEKVKKVANLPIVKNKIKVSDWFEKWLELYIKPYKKKATFEQYRILYEKHIYSEIGKRYLTTIKQYDIQQVIAKMNDKELSTWTMKHVRKIMHIAFEKALKDKLISENPVNEIEIPKKQAKPRKTLTPGELKEIFKELKNTRWYWAVRFMLVTGLRRGELLALRWNDIDYENRRIRVDESNGRYGLGDTKSAEVHYAPLSDLAIYYLKQQKEMLINEFNPILHDEELKKQDLIFPSKDGTMLRPSGFNSVLDRVSKKIGIKISPHMFRHTFVYMAKGKMTLSELQEALGHDESTTTLDIYGTLLSDTINVAAKIDEAFATLDEEINKIENNNQAKVINIFERRKIKSR